jgi:hypothetical protein
MADDHAQRLVEPEAHVLTVHVFHNVRASDHGSQCADRRSRVRSRFGWAQKHHPVPPLGTCDTTRLIVEPGQSAAASGWVKIVLVQGR